MSASTNETHHVGAVIELLEGADASDWSTATPDIRAYWEDAQSERGPGADQPPVLYVWSPVDSTFERFSVDEENLRENSTVEVQVWTLDATESKQVYNDLINYLSEFLDDNKTNTPYADIQPSTGSDFREQTPARNTDHYIMSVQVDTDGLTKTGLA